MNSIYRRPASDRPHFRIPPQLILGAIIALFALGRYWLGGSTNPVTGARQHTSLTVEQEVAIGRQSAPEMARQFGGLSADRRADATVDAVGAKIARAVGSVAASGANIPEYPFEFHVLADAKTVNAFALPGGQVFITEALLTRLETEGQLAGVLGHEIGHVVGRHSAERMAKAELAQGLAGATGVAASGGNDGGYAARALAARVAEFALMSYGRKDELEADALGLRFIVNAGYDPRALIRVMEILEQASGGSRQTEFMSTHPNPGNRSERIRALIDELYPSGVPQGLTP